MSEIKAPITGNVWKVLVEVGDAVEVDQMVAILESMKLEIPVESEVAGTVTAKLSATRASGLVRLTQLSTTNIQAVV